MRAKPSTLRTHGIPSAVLLTLALLALPALSTEMFTTPWVLLRTRPLAAAMSGCRKLELKVM